MLVLDVMLDHTALMTISQETDKVFIYCANLRLWCFVIEVLTGVSLVMAHLKLQAAGPEQKR